MVKPTLVRDFKDKKISLISAGAHHSVIMTQQGDVYVCGNNKDGQLGLGDCEARNSFTYLRSLADKNVYRLFCGGNHTWALIDEFMPMRVRPRVPSPLYQEIEEIKKVEALPKQVEPKPDVKKNKQQI